MSTKKQWVGFINQLRSQRITVGRAPSPALAVGGLRACTPMQEYYGLLGIHTVKIRVEWLHLRVERYIVELELKGVN